MPIMHVPFTLETAEEELPAGGPSPEFRCGVIFAELCQRQAREDEREILDIRGAAILGTLDRLENAVDRLAKDRPAMPRTINLAETFLAEVINFGGFPVTRADAYRLTLETTKSTQAADWMAFGPGTRRLYETEAEPYADVLAELERLNPAD